MTSAPGSSPSPRPEGAHSDGQRSDGRRPRTAQQAASGARAQRSPTTGRMPWGQDTGVQPGPGTRRLSGRGVSELSPHLLGVLRCPLTRGRLQVLDEHHLMSELPHLEGIHPVYEVSDGIPHLLPAQAMAGRTAR